MATEQRRDTRQRAAVSDALGHLEGFITAQELHTWLRVNGSPVGLATIYRTLQQLTEDGELDVVRGADGSATYRRCSPRHHHHLVCRVCRRTVEVNSHAIERWAAETARANGFADVEHVVEIFGLCAHCSAAAPAETPSATRSASPS